METHALPSNGGTAPNSVTPNLKRA